MDVSLESKSLLSVGNSRKSYLQVTSQKLARGKLVHLHGWRSLALPGVGSSELKKNSPGKRYQRIRTCLTGEVETSSSPIRRQVPDVKYPEKVERRKGDHLRVQSIGTPPPDDTERASLSGATPSGFLKRTRSALPYPE
uniref:Uncharacterized protein n=1 Tax=Vitis vinifera TaxID=29760 RepID=A5C0C3_VITVI|nr:hypothetical protein VITISV_031521 [Vitis vinifera]